MLALIFGVLFMAPRAVMVAGLVSDDKNGHIAIAGPLVNLGLFIIGIPLGVLLFMLTGAAEFAGQQHIDGVQSSAGHGLRYRSLVVVRQHWPGLFNMIPFGPLDGLKVK